MAEMNRPSREEILRGVALFLREDLASRLNGDLRFQTLISASLLEIVLRELTLEPVPPKLSAELDALVGGRSDAGAGAQESQARLGEKIRQGDFDEEPARSELLRYLAQAARRKIQVDNPKW